jgi:hypothetical protein
VLASALFAKVVRTPAKEWIEKTFDGNTFGKFLDGMFKEYGLMGLDLVSTGVGAFLATGFKALTKIGNSAYLASALFVDGVFDLGENYILEWFELESIPPVTEGLAWRTLFKNLVFIFSIYWHSLLLSRKKVKDFERSSGKRKLGMKVLGKAAKLRKALIAPIQFAVKLLKAFSMAIQTAFNLKGEPKTMFQVIQLTCEANDLPPPKLMITQFVITFSVKAMVAKHLKEYKMFPSKYMKQEEEAKTEMEKAELAAKE